MRAAVLAVLILAGCAARPFSGICGFAQIGQDERGVQYVRYYCEPGR